MKGNRAIRFLALVATLVILACSLSLFAFAEGSAFSIPDGTKVVTPGMVPNDTTTVNIPSSVVSIESGAFANCKGLNTVNIDNTSGSVLYDASAFYGGTISVHYLKANVPTTVATTEATTVPETTTEPETEVVTDMTPFASAKQELSDVDVWNKLVSNAGPLESPQDTSSVLSKVIAYFVTSVVCAGAVALCVIKFKK
ncbi:MAG: leucine-rich repeat domain-containing protein [Clostridia bacterium]|nr:leucine-rich repeat domain-containing protein [Clostridia bacterium]